MQEIVYQLLAAGVSGVIGMVGMYAKAYIETKMKHMDYEFENSRIERILDNAVNYADRVGKEYAEVYAKRVAGDEHLSNARKYINRIDPKLVVKLGNELNVMIERKIEQKSK